jgi:opacity protein-like surface antigen
MKRAAACPFSCVNDQQEQLVMRIQTGYKREKCIMKNGATNESVCFLLIAIFISSSSILFAGTEPVITDGKDYSKEVVPVEKSWCETPSLWEVRIGLPGWLAGISGDSGVKGLEASSDVKFTQLLKHLTHVPVALSINARYRRWEFWVDGQYIEVGTHASLPGLLFTDANVHIKNALAEGFVGYRLINCDNANLTLFAGARWTYLAGDLSIFDNGDARLVILRELLGIRKRLDFSDSIGWVDPVVGMRGRLKIFRATKVFAEGDVGGFNANADTAYELQREGRTIVRKSIDSTDWSYQLAGGLEFQLTRNIWLQTGWRYMKYDFQKNGFTDKNALNGPFIQAGVNF